MTVANRSGQLVRLGNLVRLREEVGPAQIDRVNRQRAVTIVSDLLPSLPLATAIMWCANVARIAALIGVIVGAFALQVFLADPDPGEVVQGFVPGFSGTESVLLAVGIIGATVMPHVIYLHSALFDATDEATVADAVFLAERVLCLAIHQDLDVTDIDRSVAAIRHEFANGAGP